MDQPVKDAKAKDASMEPLAEEAELNAEQRELLRSLHRSFQQAARGETRPAQEFLEEWRLEREAKSNARSDGA